MKLLRTFVKQWKNNMTRREKIEKAAMQVGGVHPDWDALECFRVGYKEGAQWADKTMIEKACEWIIENMPHYVSKDYTYEVDMADDFRKAMEE